MNETLDPILDGLFRRLPKTGEQWSFHKRAAWLRAMASAFELIYQPDVTETVIGVRLVRQNPAGTEPAGLAEFNTSPVEYQATPKNSTPGGHI